MALYKKPWLTQTTLWISYFILLVWFYSEMRSFEATLVKSLFIVSIQCCIFYLNYHLLLPHFFEKKRYLLYGAAIVIVITVSLILFYYFDRYSFAHEFRDGFGPGRGGRGYGMRQGQGIAPQISDVLKRRIIQRHVMFNGFFIVVVLFLSTILRNLQFTRKREQEAVELRNQALEAESKMLKWQINPHFLFNTLNNLYYLSQVKSDKTPDAIHRLSGMLRYVIYDCNEPYVKLSQELEYLKGYIELQLLKFETSENITYNFNAANPGLKIAPLLLITFVENSFKHSAIGNTTTAWIRIKIETQERRLRFEIENSIPVPPQTSDGTTGIGLENVKRRLHLLYPDSHSLNLREEKGVFSVTLLIDLHED